MTHQPSRSTTNYIVMIFVGVLLVAGLLIAPANIRAAGPGACPSDSKLLNGGATLVFGEGRGTWWGLIQDGVKAAGLDLVSEQIDYLNWLFSTNYSDLNSLKDFNLRQVSAWDENGNGYVCAFDLRGTRAHFRDPLSEFTYYGITDDRIAKK